MEEVVNSIGANRQHSSRSELRNVAMCCVTFSSRLYQRKRVTGYRSKRLGLRDFRTPERVSSAGSLAEGERNFRTGGERGIRTLDRVSPIHAFQACAFNHSAISPSGKAVFHQNSMQS